MEETGELMLQTGCFSLRDFIQIFTDKEVGARAGPLGGWAARSRCPRGEPGTGMG